MDSEILVSGLNHALCWFIQLAQRILEKVFEWLHC